MFCLYIGDSVGCVRYFLMGVTLVSAVICFFLLRVFPSLVSPTENLCIGN
jgi:hypothetical protein